MYTTKTPTLRIAIYNIGKNELSENVAEFYLLNSAVKKLMQILSRFLKWITKQGAVRKLINYKLSPILIKCTMHLVKRWIFMTVNMV